MDPQVQSALAIAWTATNGICGKRLVPFLPELIATLERHNHVSLSDEVRQQVLSLSPATADRLLRPLREPRGVTTTKPGRLLKQHIPGARSRSGPTASLAYSRLTWSPTAVAAWEAPSCTR